MQYSYLENTSGGHNKFYQMTEIAGNKWIASWGAIGKSGQTKDYSMTEWYDKYHEKIKKGYVDKTNFKTPKQPFVVNTEHLKRVDNVMLILIAHSSQIQDSIELIRDVGAVRDMLKDPKSKCKGNLEKDDMLFLNEVWKKIKHFTKASLPNNMTD